MMFKIDIDTQDWPLVECRVHPGKLRVGYWVCYHAMTGAELAHHKEPDPKMHGLALCALCAKFIRPQLMVPACPLCVEYHLLHREQATQEEIPVPQERPDVAETREMAFAEKQGMLAFDQARGLRQPPRNPYGRDNLLAWAFDLGWRLRVACEREKRMTATA